MIEQNINENLEGLKVQTDQEATSFFNKIRYIKSLILEKEKIANSELLKVQNWLGKETEELKSKIEFYEQEILVYFSKMKENNDKYKLKTPWGEVSTRKQQQKYDFNDEKTIEYFKLNNPEIIKTKLSESYDKTAAKKLFSKDKNGNIFDQNGEIIDFLIITDQPEKREIKVTE